MRIVKTDAKKAAKKLNNFDWSHVDLMTGKDVARQIAANPDAAPDISVALKNGSMRRPVKPEQIKAVRRKTGLSQTNFAARSRTSNGYAELAKRLMNKFSERDQYVRVIML